MIDSQAIHKVATEARASAGPVVLRYVLMLSLVLVVAMLAVIVAMGWMG
jgi:hypothetical protein